MKNVLAILFVALVAPLSTGCVMEQAQEEPLEIGSTTQLILGTDFKANYCQDNQQFMFCGTELEGRTVFKHKARELWVYVAMNGDGGVVKLRVDEKDQYGDWEILHDEQVIDDGYIYRHYSFSDTAFRRVRLTRAATGEIYHMAVKGHHQW